MRGRKFHFPNIIADAIRSRAIAMLCIVVAGSSAGCLSPTARFNHDAEKQGLERRSQGSLVLYQKGQLVDGEPIHIYLDGDGTPSPGRGRVSLDPTSRERLILRLIAVDPSASVLVGRPCYYGGEGECDPALWTGARYSQAVVDQLAGTINAVIADVPGSAVVLIGYSGGGTLAMLAAPLLTRLDTVVTIAANLDTEAWIEHHGYSPLSGSLNPATSAPLPARIRQVHLFGEMDENVPAQLARRTIERQSGAVVEIIPGFGHRCCWPDIWASKIADISGPARAATD